jgi:hypothetical protein
LKAFPIVAIHEKKIRLLLSEFKANRSVHIPV